MSCSSDALPTPASTSNTRTEPKKRSAVTTKANTNGEITTTTNVNDLVVVKGKDLVNKSTIGGGPMVERPKEVVDLRKGLATPTIAYERKRKHVSRSETPKWQTALNVVMKLCLLLVGLVWLGQMISNLSNGNTANYPVAAVESDGSISEVESFVNKTAKMLQVQLDAVEKKIGSEIGAASRELAKKIEEKSAVWEKELRKLEMRTEGLGKSLGGVKGMGLLTKEEFESFKNELKKKRGSYERDEDVSLDEIGTLAKEIVEKEIEKHVADGLGRVDYALASGGARVILHSEPFVSGEATNWFPIGKYYSRVHSNAKKMLEPSFGEPGQCFGLQGSSGYVVIKLRTGIIPEAVTLEHVSKSVAYDRSSAPKDCVVSAWFEGSGDPGHAQVLTKFSYDLEKSNAQTFDVETTSKAVVNVVRLEFMSNHGNPSLTCIYRFRVHGYEYRTLPIEESNSLPKAENAGLR